MQTDRILDDIREMNLAYLMLAKHLIREDRAQAIFRLGISEELADLIHSLSAAQVLKLAASNMLMFRFRFEGPSILGLLTSHGAEHRMNAVHAAILAANQVPETV